MHSRRRAAAILAATLIGTAGGCAGQDSFAQRSAPVMGGTDDTTDTNVVGIFGLVTDPTSGRQSAFTCSGSLLLPNLVLTARHCVSHMSTAYFACSAYTDPMTHTAYVPTTAAAPYAASSFYITSDPQILMNSNFVRAAEVIVPANSTNVPACGKDIALIRLATPITGVTPLIPRLDVAPLTNETFTAVGYGATDGSGTGTGAGTRRYRTGLQVVAVGMQSSGSVQFTADQEWIGNTGTCEGDSGGPAVDLLGEVIGSVSRGGAGTCDNPIYTRVDLWADFIRQAATSAASAGGTAPPSWINAPAANSANFGDACTGDLQCVSPLSCLNIAGARRCTDTGCACPSAWVCGMSAEGYQACVPDPNATPDAGTQPAHDSGAATGSDGGTTGDSHAASDGATTMGSSHGGCSASPSTPASRGNLAAVASAFLALAFVSRRRVRHAAGQR